MTLALVGGFVGGLTYAAVDGLFTLMIYGSERLAALRRRAER